jgi:uncharacterized protein YdaU (DUF1376 family)
MQSASPRAGALSILSGATERGANPLAQFPMLPFWTDAYLGDTTHLTTIEHGAYVLLLITMWRVKGDKKRLPADDRTLARYAKLTSQQWARIKPTISPFFDEKDGFWYNGRLSDEYVFVKQQRVRQSNAGKASALKRKNRGSTSVPTTEQPPANPLPTPNKENIQKKKSDGGKGSRIDPDLELSNSNGRYAWDQGFAEKQIRDLWEEFKTYWHDNETKKAIKKNWDQAWQTWVRKDIKFNGHPGLRPGGRPTKNQLAG